AKSWVGLLAGLEKRPAALQKSGDAVARARRRPDARPRLRALDLHRHRRRHGRRPGRAPGDDQPRRHPGPHGRDDHGVPRALDGSGPPLAGDAVAAHVRVVQAGELLESHFVVPLGTGMTGAAGIPPEGCVTPDRRPDDGQRLPRCVLAFPRTVTFIAASPDGSTAFVGVLGTGVSAWRMPGVQFLEGFAPPPPIAVPVTEVPHPEAANAIAVSPDGAEAAVAVENRVLVYVTAGGRLLRQLPAYPGVVRALAWSPAAARLLVTVFYDPSGHLLAAGDGREVRRLVVEREGAAVAFSPD